MYISELAIENIRNFKRRTIEFNDGINVIVEHNSAVRPQLAKELFFPKALIK